MTRIRGLSPFRKDVLQYQWATSTSLLSHTTDATIHFIESSIDHVNILNIGTNTHAVIDTHIADGTIHFTEASVDHTAILNIGTNSHATIDTHIADATIHFTEGSIDHTAILNIGTNSHIVIDTHIADGTLHFTEASINHTAILNIGVNTHAVIDTHIADVNIHVGAGTSTNNTLRWSGTAWVETTVLTTSELAATSTVSLNSINSVPFVMTMTEFAGNSIVNMRFPSVAGNILVMDSSGTLQFGDVAGTGGLVRLGGGPNAEILFKASANEMKVEVRNTIDWGFRNETDSGWMYISGQNAASADVDMITADPDGAVTLNFGGITVAQTLANGLQIADTSGSDTRLTLATDASVATAYIRSVISLLIRNFVHGAPIVLEGENTAGTLTTLLVADPDSALDLYYAGSVKFVTTSNGAQINGGLLHLNNAASASSAHILVNNSEGGYRIRADGDTMTFIQTNSAGSDEKNWVVCRAGDAIELLHNDVKTLSTQNHGIDIFGNLNNADGGSVNTYMDFHTTTGSLRGRIGFLNSAHLGIDNNNNNGELRLTCAGSGGALSSILRIGVTGTVTPQMGFFTTAPVSKPTGVAVTAVGIHAALVTLGLISA